MACGVIGQSQRSLKPLVWVQVPAGQHIGSQFSRLELQTVNLSVIGSSPILPAMDITFKYNNKIITTPNLEKKLKRMKLSINDIEIIDNPITKKEPESGIEDYMLNKRQVIVRSTEDDIRRICYVDKDKGLPTIYELFKKDIWNPKTKTGIKYLTPEFLMTMYYEP